LFALPLRYLNAGAILTATEHRPIFANSLPNEGEWRAKKRADLWYPQALNRPAAGASRRATSGVLLERIDTGPRFLAARQREVPDYQPAPGRDSYWSRATLREDRERRSQQGRLLEVGSGREAQFEGMDIPAIIVREVREKLLSDGRTQSAIPSP